MWHTMFTGLSSRRQVAEELGKLQTLPVGFLSHTDEEAEDGAKEQALYHSIY